MTISQLLDIFCNCFNMRAWKAESPAEDYLESNSEETTRFSERERLTPADRRTAVRSFRTGRVGSWQHANAQKSA
jgi:hypothetical protein